MKKERLIEIDHLRGLAMLAMILIHTNAYFLGDSAFVKNLWDFSQFAVPVFIMCSAYLFFIKIPAFTFSFVKKRFFRLLKPYYIFMLVFFLAIFLREPAKLTPTYIWQSIILTGGIDINWLVLLFVQFIFIIPFIAFAWKKFPVIFWLYTGISVFSSLLFVFWKFPYDYRFIMWLPYSTLLIYTALLVKFGSKKVFYFLSLFISGVTYLVLRTIEIHMQHSLTFFDNKYPPNLYFLSFGIFSIAFLYSLASKHIFDLFGIKQLFDFLSRNSYSLYFIHYLYLYLISWTFNFLNFNWITFFLCVFCLSVITQYVCNRLVRVVSTGKN